MDYKTAVSVVIPVYNVEEYLQQCIESVITQTYRCLDIILVDDGSTDSSGVICDEFKKKDNRIRVIHKKNGGLSDARNKGLIESRGKYIYFLDSDDYLVSTAIEEIMSKVEQYDLDMVLFDADVVDEEGKLITNPNIIHRYHRKKEYISILNGKDMFKQLIGNKEYYSCVPMLFFKKELVLNTFENILHEDELFTIQQLYHCEKVLCLPVSYYQRRIRSDSITTVAKTYKHYYGMATVIEKLLQLPELDETIVRYVCTLYQVTLIIYKNLSYEDKVKVQVCKRDLKKIVRAQYFHGSMRLSFIYYFSILYPIFYSLREKLTSIR